MIKLCGLPLSNYYNKVKIALIEKDVPFTEEAANVSQSPEMLARSPLGKIPFIELPDGSTLCESQVILEYLEDAYPGRPMLPAEPVERARIREICALLETNVELVARRLYYGAFFGGPAPSDELKKDVRRELKKGLRALRQRTRFAPFIAGATFSWADCAAVNHLPLVAQAVKVVFDEDVYGDWTPAIDAYRKAMSERPSVRRVLDERKAWMAAQKKG